MDQKLSVARDGRKRRIVWLEDEKPLVRFVEEIKPLFEQGLSGVDVLWFTNGDDAWRELCEREPDVFITDDLHPGMSGIELLVRLNEKRVCFPIVWTSARIGEIPSFPSIKIIPMIKPWTFQQLGETLAICLKPFSPLPNAQAR